MMLLSQIDFEEEGYISCCHTFGRAAAGGRRVGSCPAEASPLATLCVRGKMQRSLAGNIYVFQVLWDWLH